MKEFNLKNETALNGEQNGTNGEDNNLINVENLSNAEIEELVNKINELKSIDFSQTNKIDIDNIINKISGETNLVFKQNMLIGLYDIQEIDEPVKGSESYSIRIKKYKNLKKIFLSKKLLDVHNELLKYYDEITKDCF